MARARDLLERFRPIGTPGAAAPAGVPVDRLADRERELAPVLALLEDVEAACSAIRDEAAAEAVRRRESAVARAAEVTAAARRAAPVTRADATARARGDSSAQLEALVEQGEREAHDVTERSRRRMDDYVARVVASVTLAVGRVEEPVR